MAGHTFDRRKVLALGAGGALTLGLNVSGCSLPWLPRPDRTFGASVCSWDGAVNHDAQLWQAAVRDMHQAGLGHVSLISYAFVDPETGAVSQSSQNGLASGPAHSALEAAAAEAQRLGMEYSIRPWVEIDNEDGPGVEWRGYLELDEEERETFAETYSDYVLSLAKLARQSEARCLYIGSELKGLTTDSSAKGDWLRLIKACRTALAGSSCLVGYAANFDEYEDVPFWAALDEIGVDAYFPLAREAQARGAGKPDAAVLDQACSRMFKRLKAFSRRHERPLYICEWGLVPLDGTTAEPSNELPSPYVDPEEAVAGYRVFLDHVARQGEWLTGVDFWHWQVDPNEDSNYRIRSGSEIANLIKDAANGSKNGSGASERS